MLSPLEAFKVGFLERCVRDGLTPTQMLEQVKQASDMLEKRAFLSSLLSSAGNAIGNVAHTATSYGLPIALAAPPILGGLAGYGLAKATDVNDTDVDAVKNREIAEEYRRQTEILKRRKAMRDYSLQLKRSGRPV